MGRGGGRPSPRIEPLTWRLGDGVLGGAPGPEVPLRHSTVHRHGALGGIWCPHGWAQDLPADQRDEDALCLTFTTAPLGERLELLGRPRLRLDVAVDRPRALVFARLCDVAPDGTSTLISRGALNLTHRDGPEEPPPMEPGRRTTVGFELSALGQAIPTGHRLRLALATAYWPWLWPSPEPVELTVFAGDAATLELPVRPPLPADDALPSFGPAVQASGLESRVLQAEAPYRVIRRDPAAGTIVTESNGDGNERVHHADSGIEVSWRYLDRTAIHDTDPLSAHVLCERMFGLARGEWQVRVETMSSMTADADAFHVDDRLEAFEGDRRLFVRSWSRSFPRSHL